MQKIFDYVRRRKITCTFFRLCVVKLALMQVYFDFVRLLLD